MKNKGFIIFLTLLISFLSIYYLQFTFVSQNIQDEASEFSRDESGNVNFNKKQKYLDSIWNVPVYSFIKDFTFKEIKETELNLGLDLQGGMHVTLEVSPIDIVKGLSGNNQDVNFNQALNNAKEKIKGTQLNFVDEFYNEFKKISPQKKLSLIFSTVSNRGRIDFDSSDDEILDIINFEVENAIDRSFNILRTRIDRFGTSQPNIQRQQGTGRIQIELPGVDNPERVRKLLQGVAKLEFWEVSELNEPEVTRTLSLINQYLISKDNQAIVNNENNNGIKEDQDLADLLIDSDEPSLSSSDTSSTGDNVLDSLQNSISSPLFSLMKSEFGGLFYNVKDTISINNILTNDQVKLLIPPTLKFLWAVKPFETATPFPPSTRGKTSLPAKSIEFKFFIAIYKILASKY